MRRLPLVLGLLAAATIASAQTPPPPGCADRLDCAKQRILDLREHRAWLEDQVALAKALLAECRQQVSQKDAELNALKGGREKP